MPAGARAGGYTAPAAGEGEEGEGGGWHAGRSPASVGCTRRGKANRGGGVSERGRDAAGAPRSRRHRFSATLFEICGRLVQKKQAVESVNVNIKIKTGS